jgi:hypothetical protein
MTIEWNKVTWYSKLAAVIVFVGVFWLGFWLGTMKAEKVYVEVPHMVHHAEQTLDKATSTITLGDVGGISNWKTYTNDEFGFSFKYPPSLGSQLFTQDKSELSSDDGNINSSSVSHPFFEVSLADNLILIHLIKKEKVRYPTSGGGNSTQTFNAKTNTWTSPDPDSECKIVSIGKNVSAYETGNGDGGYGETAYFITSNRDYMIVFYRPYGPKSTKEEDALTEKILGTFELQNNILASTPTCVK